MYSYINWSLLMERQKRITVISLSALLCVAITIPFVRLTQANPIISVYNDIPPPEGAQAPIITIHTPTNGSSYPKSLTLTFDVTIARTNGDKSLDGVTKIYYKGSWAPNEITVAEDCLGSFSVDLSNVKGGNHSVTIYAMGIGYIQTGEDYRVENDIIYSYNYFDRFEMVGSSTVNFFKDLVSPAITVLSPTNRTYDTPDVPLDFTVSEETSVIAYCLDGKENQTITESVILRGLAEGAHNITLYAADLAGNAATPQTVFFRVDLSNYFLVPFIASLATVAIVISFLGLRVYFKKHRRHSN
jgi:hypothetical protein